MEKLLARLCGRPGLARVSRDGPQAGRDAGACVLCVARHGRSSSMRMSARPRGATPQHEGLLHARAAVEKAMGHRRGHSANAGRWRKWQCAMRRKKRRRKVVPPMAGWWVARRRGGRASTSGWRRCPHPAPLSRRGEEISRARGRRRAVNPPTAVEFGRRMRRPYNGGHMRP